VSILFCNIGWMSRYEGLEGKRDTDKIVGGGKWIDDHGSGGEICNFVKCRDGFVYGHVETMKGHRDRAIRIEQLGASADAGYVDGITVVWTATDPDVRGRRVVGWYRDARVYRSRQRFRRHPSSQHEADSIESFCVRARVNNAVLLPMEMRGSALKSGKGWMGHVPWWFPQRYAEADSEIAEFLRRLNVLMTDGVEDEVAEVARIRSATNLTVTQKKVLLDARIGQGQFRQSLINEWGGCALMGCTVSDLLRASHIKPWKLANNQERLDHNNGLLLLASLDAAFECGLIGFSDSGKILISPSLAPRDRQLLGITSDTRLRIPPSRARQAYLQYHRAEKFRA